MSLEMVFYYLAIVTMVANLVFLSVVVYVVYKVWKKAKETSEKFKAGMALSAITATPTLTLLPVAMKVWSWFRKRKSRS